MNTRVTVVDYGLGNIFSLKRALSFVGADVFISSDPDEIAHAPFLVLPGVGAFGDGMCELRQRGLIEPIIRSIKAGHFLIGICLGMQLLFETSEEFGHHEGLGLVKGAVVHMRSETEDGNRIKLPHVGWNELHPAHSTGTWNGSGLFAGLEPGDAMYFVHSYAVEPSIGFACVAETRYGGHSYCTVVKQDTVLGFQFHPEKSGDCGLHLLRNCLQKMH
jgi:imidazole glycerol-phosphate synthase subunit HisH